jgi:hypothetical protein
MAEPQANELVERLDVVRLRLARLADVPAPRALTEPDPRTGERWEWGQVWAHVAEFPAYWTNQIRLALAAGGDEPVPFGRVSSDPDRVDAIERERRTPPTELWVRATPDLDDVRGLMLGLDERGWGLQGLHSTLGVMSMSKILEEFVVGHLESHAGQLAGLAAAGGGSEPG